MRLERALLAIALAVSVAILAGCATTPAPSNGVKKEDAATKREEAARIHTELGQRYLSQGKLEIALDKLNMALTFDKNYVDAHTVIALLYERIGNFPKAEEHYKRAVELKPNGGNELNNYGAFLCRLGRYDEAQTYFTRALADPFYQTPAVALANSGSCFLKAGKPAEAEKALRLALEKSPGDAETLFGLASVLYEKGDYFNARAFIQRFEAASKPRADALMLGRNIELKLGDGHGAGEYTHKLMQAFPDSPEARSLTVKIERR